MENNQTDGKIFVIDDSPVMIDVLLKIIPESIKRQVAVNGIFALKLLRNCPELPDLILLDVVMPVMDGFAVCKEIKKDRRLREIPVIFISGLSDTFDKVKAFEVGAVDYITKPFQKEEVLARITTHLEISKSKKVVKELYSETIQGIIGAMSDMLALANPEVARVSNLMKTYSEMILKKLLITDTWDLKSACVLSGLGMLSGDMKNGDSENNKTTRDIDLDIKNAYNSLNFSNDIISKIPKFDVITEIISNSMEPIDKKFTDIPGRYLGSAVLKGQILRILIYYIYQFRKDEDYSKIIKKMKNSSKESYCTEILDILEKVQKDLIESEVLELKINKIKPGMILVKDLYTPDGRLMLKAGFKLSKEMIMLIINMDTLSNQQVKVIRN